MALPVHAVLFYCAVEHSYCLFVDERRLRRGRTSTAWLAGLGPNPENMVHKVDDCRILIGIVVEKVVDSYCLFVDKK